MELPIVCKIIAVVTNIFTAKHSYFNRYVFVGSEKQVMKCTVAMVLAGISLEEIEVLE